MLADRIRQAIAVLGSDDTVDGTLRAQATAYLGEEVDDRTIHYISTSATVIYNSAVEATKGQPGWERAALSAVLIGGMALGKRLGIEDGERFAKGIKL